MQYSEGSPSCENALINRDKLEWRFLLLVGFLQQILRSSRVMTSTRAFTLPNRWFQWLRLQNLSTMANEVSRWKANSFHFLTWSSSMLFHIWVRVIGAALEVPVLHSPVSTTSCGPTSTIGNLSLSVIESAEGIKWWNNSEKLSLNRGRRDLKAIHVGLFLMPYGIVCSLSITQQVACTHAFGSQIHRRP